MQECLPKIIKTKWLPTKKDIQKQTNKHIANYLKIHLQFKQLFNFEIEFYLIVSITIEILLSISRVNF